MARTALLSLLPAALIATGWRQLEFPAEGRELALAALLGVGVALLPRRWLRAAGLFAATLLVVRFAFGLSSVGGVLSDLWNGVLDFYEISLPFDPGRQVGYASLVGEHG